MNAVKAAVQSEGGNGGLNRGCCSSGGGHTERQRTNSAQSSEGFSSLCHSSDDRTVHWCDGALVVLVVLVALCAGCIGGSH
ncbi:hypothetical protein TYRP_010020 [Tyrophagus putrescentiae]|nr:hypothetical protein TYRP_010020 [Tyrophagus putrescentiae]